MMGRAWVVVVVFVSGCTDDRTSWYDRGSYAADYAPVGGGDSVHVDLRDNIVYLEWQLPARGHEIVLCDEHQLSLVIPQAASAGNVDQLIGLDVEVADGLCKLGDHDLTVATAWVVRNGTLTNQTTWFAAGTLSIDFYKKHPERYELGSSAPIGNPEEAIRGGFDLFLVDPANRSGALVNGIFDFYTASVPDPFQ
jgi:hypothetical protein